MDKQNKSGSSVIMMVGVIFMIVSGSIFVSTSWNYIPDVVKKICLAAFTGALYVASIQVKSRWNLRKAGQTLYYLGTIFTGFTVYAFAGYLDSSALTRLFLAQIAMSIPLLCCAILLKSAPDLVFQLILTDSMVITLTAMLGTESVQLLLYSAATITLILAYLIARMYKTVPEDREGLGLVKVMFGLHAVYTIVFSMIVNLTDDAGLLLRIIPSFMILLAVSKLYRIGENRKLRILQNLCVCHFNFAVAYGLAIELSNLLSDNAYDDLCMDVMVFLFFALTAGWAFVLKRGSLLYGLHIMTLMAVLFSDLVYSWGDSHIPYTYYALFIVPILYLWEKYRGTEFSDKALKRILGLWTGLFLHFLLHVLLMAVVPQGSEFFYTLNSYFLPLQLAMILLILAETAEEKYAMSAALRSFALFFVLHAMWENPLISTVIRRADGSVIVDLENEYAVILMTIAVVLLGRIWYDRKERNESFLFKYTCFALGFLLLSNLCAGNVINALILTVGSMILLIAAVSMGSRKYAIAAAMTMSLMAIYMTRGIWMSIAWWVYLFAAGVGLVIYAVKKEKDAA